MQINEKTTKGLSNLIIDLSLTTRTNDNCKLINGFIDFTSSEKYSKRYLHKNKIIYNHSDL